MGKKSVFIHAFILLCWFFFISIWILAMNSFFFSPWGFPHWYNIAVQIGLILLPVFCLILSFFISSKIIKYLYLVGNAVAIYYFTIPYGLAWIEYLKS